MGSVDRNEISTTCNETVQVERGRNWKKKKRSGRESSRDTWSPATPCAFSLSSFHSFFLLDLVYCAFPGTCFKENRHKVDGDEFSKVVTSNVGGGKLFRDNRVCKLATFLVVPSYSACQRRRLQISKAGVAAAEEGEGDRKSSNLRRLAGNLIR